MSDQDTKQPLLSNDSLALVPQTEFSGPTLTFDFPSVSIGVAEYEAGPTGCTVFNFDHGAVAAVDIRGGAHATLYTEALQNGEGKLDAICLAGGSFYGLEAATGVAAELLARHNYSPHWGNIALVSGAIIYDFGPRDNAVYPDKALGRAALAAAQPGVFPLGPRGAGRSATVGKWLQKPFRSEHAGQGGAFREVKGVKVAVFTVVNAVGAIVDRQGRVVRGSLDPRTGERTAWPTPDCRHHTAIQPSPWWSRTKSWADGRSVNSPATCIRQWREPSSRSIPFPTVMCSTP